MALTSQLGNTDRPLSSMRARAVLALLVSVVMWGTSFIAAKSVLDDFPPITLAFIRFTIALGLLLPLLARRGLRPVWGRDAARIGLCGVALVFTAQNLGLRHAGAADASLILGGAVPVLTAVLARVVLGERLHQRALIGLVASITGVGMVFLVAIDSVGSSLLGDMLLLVSAASAAVYVVLGRRAFARYGLLAILAGSAGWGLLMLAPFALLESLAAGVNMPSTVDALILLYLGAGCSGIAYLCSAFSLRYLAASEAAVIANLEVVIGLGAASVLLPEPLVGQQIAGGVLVVVGAWLASTVEPSKVHTQRPRRSIPRILILRTRGGINAQPDSQVITSRLPG
jgi:drug/metabolite transporter (DMT)-like permease